MHLPPMRRILLYALPLAIAAPAVPAPTPYAKFLSEAGIRIGPAGKLLPFGTARPVALRQLNEAFGPPLGQRVIADCGQGRPMREVRYRGAITVAFLNGRFSGWTLDKGGRLRTDRDVAIGSARSAVRAAYPGMRVDDGSLGVMFVTDEGLGGFLNADRPQARVIALYAGETCMVS